MIVNQELVKMVGSNTLFKGISKDFLKTVIKPKNYFGVKEGTIIYTKGDESTDLFLIVEGEVKIKFCSKNKVEHRFITDFFGEEELLNKDKRASHAVANHDSILYTINSEELNNLIQQQCKISENLSKKIDIEELYDLAPEADNENSEFEESNSVLNEDLPLNDDFNHAEENLENTSDDDLDPSTKKQESSERLPN